MTREQLLRVVRRSPERVAAHDREGWLALFTRDGVVEDPVGTAPHHRPALGRFYDTFIAGNEVAFEVEEDLTCGREVVRDVVIHTRLSTGLRVDVPAYLLYEVVDEDGTLRLRRMRAIWDLRARTLSALLSGPRGLWTLCVVFATMLRVQGLADVLGYAGGLVSGIFARGPQAAQGLAAALASGDTAALASGDTAALADLFTPDARIEFPAGTPRSLAAWRALLGTGAAMHIARPIAGGWLTACRFEIEGGPQRGAGGVMVLEFERRTRKVAAARFFLRG